MIFTEDIKEIKTYSVEKIRGCLIYFLLKDNVVVYVGQTQAGISRPISHYGKKDFDTIKTIPCKRNELDFLEDKYIVKYLPKYNVQTNNFYSMERAKREIKIYIDDQKFSKPKLKRIIKLLNIEVVILNNKPIISHKDLEKIISFLQKEEKKQYGSV